MSEELDMIIRMRESLAFRILDLLTISHIPLRPVEIAEILDASQKDITATLIRLSKKNLIKKVESPKNESLWVSNLSALRMISILWKHLRLLESKYEELEKYIKELKGGM